MHSIRRREQFRFNCSPKFNQRSLLCCHRLQNWPQNCFLYISILAIDFLPLQKVESFPILFKAGFMLCFGQWCSSKHDKSRTLKSGCISRLVFSCCFSNVATMCVYVYTSLGYPPGGWETTWREALFCNYPSQILHKPASTDCRFMSQLA